MTALPLLLVGGAAVAMLAVYGMPKDESPETARKHAEGLLCDAGITPDKCNEILEGMWASWKAEPMSLDEAEKLFATICDSWSPKGTTPGYCAARAEALRVYIKSRATEEGLPIPP